MKKLITLNQVQAELLEETLDKTYLTSASALMVFLMAFYKQHKHCKANRTI